MALKTRKYKDTITRTYEGAPNIRIFEKVGEEIEAYVCELCGSEYENDHVPLPHYGDTTFSEITTVQIQELEYYGEQSAVCRKSIYDICPECFTDKLVPWFKEQGAKLREVEEDW